MREICNEEIDVMGTSNETGRLTMNIQVRVKNKSRKINGLNDTGTTGIFCKEPILKYISHGKFSATTRISGRYKTIISKSKAKFKIQLPEFCKPCTILVDATVDKDANGRHHILFEIPFFRTLI